jgi:hypothetical protein
VLKVRLFVALLMLTLGFFGVVVTDIRRDGAWNYWKYLAIAYAVLSLALSWHLKKNGWRTSLLTLWHEIAHWAGLIAAVYTASYLVHIGMIGRFEASLLILLLLALATYLAGIYIETSFLFIGVILGGFAAAIAFVDEYLYNILLPLTLLAAILLILFVRHTHKKLSR